MGVFRWFNGHQGVFRYPDFQDYDLISINNNRAVFRYNGGDGPHDPTRQPWKMVLTFQNAQSYTIEEGPDAGQTMFTGGTIVGMNVYNQSNNLLIRGTGLNGDLAFLSSMLISDELFDVYRHLTAGGHTFIGADDGSGPLQDWTGDDIVTGGGDDLVFAKDGNDFISDRGGTDTYNGQGGWDTVSYEAARWSGNVAHVVGGVTVDLAAGTAIGWDGLTDTLISIEEARGTFMLDTLLGDGQNNWFMGFQGNDIIDGRGGFDGVSFRNDARFGGTDGVRVNLRTGEARDGFGTVDQLTSIENAEGTDTVDRFIDNSQNNWFRGREGNDIFYFSRGNDQARGDDGADRFIFQGTMFGDNVIEDFEDGIDRIDIQAASNFGQLTISQDGTDALIEYSGQSIRLWNFDANDLTDADFLF